MINTFVFLDLEATGLQGVGEKPRITEVSLVATHREALLNMKHSPHKTPRVLDKLTMCVYPMKQVTPGAASITGLYNDNLLHKKDFDENLAESICLFIQRQEAPVCLVAHNGHQYDYPLLKAELEAIGFSLPDDVLCSDSLQMLRKLDAMEEEEENNQKRVEELERKNRETPCKPLARQDRLGSLGFEYGDKMEDRERLKSVKRKLFADSADSSEVEPKKSMAERNDENDNVVKQKKEADMDQNVDTVQKVEQADMVQNVEQADRVQNVDKAGLIVISDDTQEIQKPSVSKTECDQTENPLSMSQSSTASTVICDFYPYAQDTESASQGAVYYSVSEDSSTPEETTPAKTVPQLIKKLTCNETISEDSGSDQDQGKTHAESWAADSLTDDLLMGVNLERAMEEFHNSPRQIDASLASKKTAENEECGKSTEDVSSTTDAAGDTEVDGSSLMCTEANVRNVSPPILSNLEVCRKRLEMHVSQVAASSSRSGATTQTVIPPFSQKRVSYKLEEVYKRLFGAFPAGSHSAEDDCITLLKICQKIQNDRMYQWMEDNAVSFKDVEVMYEAKNRTPLKPGVFPHH